VDNLLPNIEICHSFSIYTYPFFWSFAWSISFLFMSYKIQKNDFFKIFIPFYFTLFIFTIIGAKIFFILSTSSLHFDLLLQSDLWLSPGFVFHGGFVFGLIWTLFFYILLKEKFLEIIKHLPVALLLGHGVGRMACILNGCCYGPINFFAMTLSTSFIEAICLILAAFYLDKKIKLGLKIQEIYQYLFFYLGIVRLAMEIFRLDDRGIWLGPLSPGATISFGMLFVSFLLGIFTFSSTRSFK